MSAGAQRGWFDSHNQTKIKDRYNHNDLLR